MYLLSRVVALVFGLAILMSAPAAMALQPPSPGSVSAHTLKLPDGPASVRGLSDSPSVNGFTGQVDYAIPIEVPAGPGGIAPSLQLRYSGSLGNGPFGVGWSLEVPQVRRVERNGIPSLTSADELEIDGIGASGRLVGAADGTYRVEGQPTKFRITKSGDGFLVQRADGVSLLLGAAPEARREASGRIAAWLVQQITDVSGQNVVFRYTRDRGQVYLSDVAWGPGETYHVRVHYGSRPDAVVSYRSGFEIVTALRAEAIDVESHGEVLRAYELTYDDGLPLTRLSRVRCKGRAKQGALPDLSLTYAAPTPAAVPALMTNTGGWALNVRGTVLIDVDGDSVADLLRLDPVGHSYRRNLGDGSFAAPVGLPGGEGIGQTDGRLIDLDGDARPELVVAIGGTWRVRRLVGGAWVSAGIWPGSLNVPLTGSGVVFTDLNGDGRTDVVRPSTNGIFVNFQTPAGLGPTTSLPPISPDDITVVPGASNVRVHDVNGDGLADFVWLADGWIKVFLGTGDGRFVAQTRGAYPWTASFVDAPNVHLADLNRDGLVDLVRFSAGNLEWYAGLPGAHFRTTPVRIARPETVDFDAVISVGDANGNGSADVVWSSARGLWILDLAGTTSAGMLTGVENGLGKTVAFEYAATGTLATAAARAGTPWARHVPTSIPVVVRSVVHTGGVDAPRGMRNDVRDGFWDGAERKFAGFLTARQTPEATPASTTETRFAAGEGTERVLRGQPLTVRVTNAAGTLVEASETTRAALAIPGLGTDPLLRRAAVLDQTKRLYEGVTEPVVIMTQFMLDAEGRVLEERNLGRVDRAGDESVLVKTYASDDVTWVRDRVIEEKVTDVAGVVHRHKRFYFGDDQTFLPFGQVGKGFVRKTEAWLGGADELARWMTVKETRYDAHGNPVAQFDGVSWHEVTYDPTGLFVVEERASVSGRTLRWHATWDEVLGAPTRIIGANGDATHLGYDSLGRLVSVAQGDASPSILYVYDWSAPQPRTTTYVYDGAASGLQPFTGWAPGSGWRQLVTVTNGAGEPTFSAQRLANARWIVSGFQQRDAEGRVVLKGEPLYWDQFTLPSTTPMGMAAHTFAFDEHGRVVDHVLPTGAHKRASYAALRTTMTTDALAPVTTLSDGLGRIVHTERTVGVTREEVDATYDPAGLIKRLSLQGGAVLHDFTYDALGRLVFAHDPDSGGRTFVYDARGLLASQMNGVGQSTSYAYDEAGRITHVDQGQGRVFVFHYDVAKDNAVGGNTLGRVAWIEEPAGEAHFAYDARGRVVRTKRSAHGRSVEEMLTLATSGALLSARYDDGFALDVEYDNAGRPIKVPGFWEATNLDAAGAVAEETFANGFIQRYERDALGLASRIRVARPSGLAALDVAIQRSAFGAVSSVQDGDGVGLDHTATYEYDPAGRLVRSVMGAGTQAFTFTYAYDGLQNMVARTALGPKQLGVLEGTYAHGENGAGPRQVTRITSSGKTTQLHYDAAGRVTSEADIELAYGTFDELLRVTKRDATNLPTVVAEHDYGFDGMRTWTRNADGTEQVWLSPHITDKDGQREHSVQIGSRTIAKIAAALPTTPPGGGFLGDGAVLGANHARGGAGVGWLFGSMLAAVAVVARTGARRARGGLFGRLVSALAVVLVVASVGACSSDGGGHDARTSSMASAWTTAERTFFHEGVAAGPTLLSRDDGSVVEERRYEPFGEPIEAYREVGGVPSIGDVDFHREPRNALNKDTDPNTGWSYHGARWMAPQMARWLTPDPPTRAPDPRFLAAPWDLNPYAYVRGNPLLYWDSDGRDFQEYMAGVGVGFKEMGTDIAAQHMEHVQAAVVLAGEALTAIREHRFGDAAAAATKFYEQVDPGRIASQHAWGAVTGTIDAFRTFGDDFAEAVFAPNDYDRGKIAARVAVKAMTIAGTLAEAGSAAAKSTGAARARASGGTGEARCSGGACTGTSCFVRGTLVATPRGLVPIEEIVAGDLVLSRDESTGETAYKRVEKTFLRRTQRLEALDLAATDGAVEHITTTEEHPFFIEGRGWVMAAELVPGDRITGAHGEALTVVLAAPRTEEADVWNFRVEGFHSYFVGERGAWVHNNDCGNAPKQGPTEPYNRTKHYGRTPTAADRKAVGAGSGEVADHNPPLVKRYYEGDPAIGEKPGWQMTAEERAASASDRTRMASQPAVDSHAQGGTMRAYSIQQKKANGL